MPGPMSTLTVSRWLANLLVPLTPPLVTHPYFKLDYIKQQWGGEDEYQEAVANGEPFPRNWQAYAQEIVEETVSTLEFTLMARCSDNLLR